MIKSAIMKIKIGDMIDCQCGCGNPIKVTQQHLYRLKKQGIPKFLKGHAQKLKHLHSTFGRGFLMAGPKNPNWQGGKRRATGGYKLVYAPHHPYAQKTHKVVLEHRLVIERHLGRYLRPQEHVHHRNGIKDDNRIENLEIVVRDNHFGNVKCPYCQKEFKIK